MENKDIERHYQLDQLLDAIYYLKDDPNDESLRKLAIYRREEIIKSLRALEIIKKYIMLNKSGYAYYICLNDEQELISKEEYDSLKEVLL